MSRWLRLLVGVLLSLVLLGFLAQGIQYVYVHYGKPAESGLIELLEYLFRPRGEPDSPAPSTTRPASDA